MPSDTSSDTVPPPLDVRTYWVLREKPGQGLKKTKLGRRVLHWLEQIHIFKHQDDAWSGISACIRTHDGIDASAEDVQALLLEHCEFRQKSVVLPDQLGELQAPLEAPARSPRSRTKRAGPRRDLTNEEILAQDWIKEWDVVQVTGLSRSTLLRMQERGDFPDAVKQGLRMKAWRGADVREWLRKALGPAKQ